MKQILLCLMSCLTFSLVSFGQIEPDIQTIRNELMEKMIDTKEVKDVFPPKFIVILSSNFCKNNVCQKYFDDYSDKLKFYTLEQIFQRGLSNYIIIKDIDYTKKEALR